MHIVYVLSPRGGPETCVATLAPCLLKLQHSITVIYLGNPHEPRVNMPSAVPLYFARPGPLHYYMAKAFGSWRAWARRMRGWETSYAVARQLKQIGQTNPIDLIEITEGISVAPIQRHGRVSIYAQGADWAMWRLANNPPWQNERHLISAEARQIRRADGVRALSQQYASFIADTCSFPRAHIPVIPYPVRVPNLGAEGNADKRETLCILSVGRLERAKGSDILMQAVGTRVVQALPQTRVVLAGAETELTRQDLLRYIPTQNRSQVEFLGFVENHALQEHYKTADLYVTASPYETFGYTILEAMAAGKAVIAARTGPIPELVEHGVTGLLVPPRDADALGEAMIELLQDRERRIEMGRRGREKAESLFSIDHVLGQTLAYFQTVLAER